MFHPSLLCCPTSPRIDHFLSNEPALTGTAFPDVLELSFSCPVFLGHWPSEFGPDLTVPLSVSVT